MHIELCYPKNIYMKRKRLIYDFRSCTLGFFSNLPFLFFFILLIFITAEDMVFIITAIWIYLYANLYFRKFTFFDTLLNKRQNNLHSAMISD